MYLSEEDKTQLKYEVISQELRVHLTRLIEHSDNFTSHYFINQNWLINRSRTFAGKTIYVLQADDMGEYEDCEYAWHNGEFELCFRRLEVPRLIELICEVIDRKWLTTEQVNELLKHEGASFRFSDEFSIKVEVFSLEKLEEDAPHSSEHPNIRLLVNRMASALENKDYAAVLHASASIFETLAKDVVGTPDVQGKALGKFFEKYQKSSQLPPELQSKIIITYVARHGTPLAAHGSTQTPNLTREESVVLCELTKAFVRIEYSLQGERISARANP